MPNLKTILFLIPSLHARGAERALVNLVNNLDKTQYQVTVQTLFDVGPLRGELHDDVIYKAGLPFLLRGYVQLQKLFSPTFLYRIIIRERYDIVVGYLEGVATRIISGCPFLDSHKYAWIHIEQSDIQSFAYCYRSQEEARQCYHGFQSVVSVSKSVQDSLYRVTKLQSKVLHNILEQDKIRQLSIDPVEDVQFSGSCNFISVGALTGQKGYDRLINVHRRLIAAGFLHHIYVIGEGEQRQKLNQMIQKLGATTTFHLLGFRQNPYKYIAKADAYICSSRYEGLSTTVSEALILGKPVVSTDCGGAKELLGEQNEYGIVTPNSEQGLSEGMLQLLANPDLLEFYSQMSVSRAQEFSKEKILSLHDRLFS